jgi:hypothetical protein
VVPFSNRFVIRVTQFSILTGLAALNVEWPTHHDRGPGSPREPLKLCTERRSGPFPELKQRAVSTNYRIGIGKDQMGHSRRHGGSRCLSADVPTLVGRIGSDDEEVGCCVETTMACARRKERNIPSSGIDFTPSGPS